MEDWLVTPLHDAESRLGVRTDAVQISRYRPGYPASALYGDWSLDLVVRRQRVSARMIPLLRNPETSPRRLVISSLTAPPQIVAAIVCALVGTLGLLSVLSWLFSGHFILPLTGSIFMIIGPVGFSRVIRESFYFVSKPEAEFQEYRKHEAAHRACRPQEANG